MLEHIVKNGETIHDILNMYHMELDELKTTNLHITDFYNLVSGMKIKIPLIHKEIEQILENTESFVQKYYPKLNDINEEEPQFDSREFLQVEKPQVQEETFEESVTTKPKETNTLHEEVLKKIEPKPKGRPYPGILPPKNRYGR